jgi:hypothetical protein
MQCNEVLCSCFSSLDECVIHETVGENFFMGDSIYIYMNYYWIDFNLSSDLA